MKKIIHTLLAAVISAGVPAWSDQVLKENNMGVYSLEALKVVISLAIVLLIFYAGVTLFKKYMGGNYKANSSIKVIGGLSIGHKEKLVLVEAGNVNLLLGVSSAGVNKLHCFSDQELSCDVEQENTKTASFNQHLNEFTG